MCVIVIFKVSSVASNNVNLLKIAPLDCGERLRRAACRQQRIVTSLKTLQQKLPSLSPIRQKYSLSDLRETAKLNITSLLCSHSSSLSSAHQYFMASPIAQTNIKARVYKTMSSGLVPAVIPLKVQVQPLPSPLNHHYTDG